MKKVQFRVGSGERKILIVLIYYAILNVFALMALSLAVRNGYQYRMAVRWNFLCESAGHNPENPCDRSQVSDLKFPEINIVAYLLLVSIPNVNLIFVINWRKLKHWFCVHVVRDKSHVYARSQSSISMGTKRLYSSNSSYSTSAEYKLRSNSTFSMGKINTSMEYNMENILGTETTPNGGGVVQADDKVQEELHDSCKKSNSLTSGTTANGTTADAVESPLEGNRAPLSPTGELYHFSSAI